MLASLAPLSARVSQDEQRYAYALGNPSSLIDPSGLMVLYTGFSGTAGVSVGLHSARAVGAVGGAFGLDSSGFSSALVLSSGVTVTGTPSGTPIPPGQVSAQLSVGAEIGIYWGLPTACHMQGPFVSFAADLYYTSIALEWSVNVGALPDLVAAVSSPVGITFGTFIGTWPGVDFQAIVTTSEIYFPLGCCIDANGEPRVD
jgi:hypothetical protein